MLENRIERLEAQQSKTNELLTAILDVLRSGAAAPVQPKPAQEASKTQAQVTYTTDDVRKAFLARSKKHGSSTLIAIIKDIAGEVPNMGHIPETKIPAVLAAFEALDAKGVA